MEKILEFFGLLGVCFLIILVMCASFEKDVHRASRQMVIDSPPDDEPAPQDLFSTLIIGLLCAAVIAALAIMATHQGIANGVVGN